MATTVGQQDVSLRVQAAVYGTGLFSTSMFYMASVVVPLYAVTLHPSPLMLGLVLGGRHFLPLLFSIHAGALMDRLGARRVMLVFAVLGVVVPLLYPTVPLAGALLVFQMLSGLADSMGWLGAQTMIGQYMQGRTAYAGRLSFVIRFGHLIAPPMAGAAWDYAGPWGAFGCLALWGLGTLVCALLVPPPAPGHGASAGPGGTSGRVRLRELLPDPADYRQAFRLLAAPSVLAVVALGAMMHVGNSVQSTFYVVWLEEIGISGTAIGVLASIGAVGAALFSLATAPLVRRISGFWLLLGALWAGIVLIAITPLLGSYPALLAAMFLRSGANGLAQPLVITLVLRGAGAASQGKAVGLRGTANRSASILAPIVMGALVEATGMATSFYVVGAAVSLLMAGMGLYLWRRPDITRAGED